MTYQLRASWICALIVFFGALLIYRVWLPQTYSGDDLQYTILIQQHVTGDLFYHPAGGQPYVPQSQSFTPLPPLPNPRYLLEWPASILIGRLWHTLGWGNSAIDAIQAIRILVGALGLVAFYLAIQSLTQHPWISLSATVGLGISVSYWTYSTHMDQSINMTALLCLAFYLFARQTQTGFTQRGIFSVIIVLGLASLCNFTAAVSAIAFAFGLVLFQHNISLQQRTTRFLKFGLTYGSLVIIVILGGISVMASPGSIVDPQFWREATFGGKPEYGINPIQDALRGALGLAKSQVLFPGLPGSLQYYYDTVSQTERIELLAFYAVILLIMALPFVLLLLRQRPLSRIVLFLTIWLALHALFNWFWDPGFNKYWLIPLVCCWAMAGLALNHLRNERSQYYRPAWMGTVVFIAVSFGLNLTTLFLPESRVEDNQWRQNALTLKAESQPADLFISPAHPMDFYLAYFAQRDVISTGLIAYAHGGNEQGLAASLELRIADHRADGGQVYIYGLETLSDEQRLKFEKLFNGSQLQEVRQLSETILYELVDA